MKKWLFFGYDVDSHLHDEIYVQFMANVFSAVTTAILIGGYHVIFHL